jgi:hypothetical protein
VPKASLLANPASTIGLAFLDPLAFNSHGQVLQPAVSLGPTGPGENVLAVGNMGVDGKPLPLESSQGFFRLAQ